MAQDHKLRVLQINASTKGYGGVSAILFNIYKHIDRSRVTFDFLSPDETTYEVCRDEIEAMGGHLYGLGIHRNKLLNKFLLSKRLSAFLREHDYDIVHINSGALLYNLQVAAIAKRCGIKRIIVHAHSTLNKSKKLKNLMVKIAKPLLNLFATDFFTCSDKAAQDMFTAKTVRDKVVTVKNGIETERFAFNSAVRSRMREELGVDDKLVICSVGRFDPKKNQLFLIECFKEMHELNPETVLVLVGSGELENAIKSKVKASGLENDVLFLGMRMDVNEILQAADIFILPSIAEGYPIVGVESQTAGVFTVVSSNITAELGITDNILFLDLDKGAHFWAETILQSYECRSRDEYRLQVVERGYDIKDTSEALLKIYEENVRI